MKKKYFIKRCIPIFTGMTHKVLVTCRYRQIYRTRWIYSTVTYLSFAALYLILIQLKYNNKYEKCDHADQRTYRVRDVWNNYTVQHTFIHYYYYTTFRQPYNSKYFLHERKKWFKFPANMWVSCVSLPGNRRTIKLHWKT